jgi:protein transport protein SEC61 subunit gamma-like protein
MSSSDLKESAQQVVDGPKQFFKEGVQFINRCKKPDQQGKEICFFIHHFF